MKTPLSGFHGLGALGQAGLACGALAAAAWLAGCNRPVLSAGSCSRFAGRYAIDYSGGALGKGELVLKSSASDANALEGDLVLWDETGTGAVLRASGPGACGAELVSLTFGAADDPRSKVRLIGGTTTIVPPQGAIKALFGVWRIEAVLKDAGELRELSGFVRQSEPASKRGSRTK